VSETETLTVVCAHAQQLFRLATRLESEAGASEATGGWWGQRYAAFLTALREERRLDALLAARLPPLVLTNDDDEVGGGGGVGVARDAPRRDDVAASCASSVGVMSSAARRVVRCVRDVLLDGRAPSSSALEAVVDAVKRGDCGNDPDDADQFVALPATGSSSEGKSTDSAHRELSVFFESFAGK
jgi:hypothetical protein